MESVRRGRPEAARTIWNWRATGEPEASSHRQPRLRGTIQAAVGVGIGSVFWWLGHGGLGTVAFTIASLLLLSALFSPHGLYQAIDRALRAFGRWVGRVLSWILLPIIFYLVFFPFGLFFRRNDNDTMKRTFDADADTYWSPHKTTPASISYRRQF